MLINLFLRIFLGLSLVVCSTSVFAETVTTQSTSNRGFIKLTDSRLKMNFRNASNVNQSLGTLSKDAVIQIPDGMAVVDPDGSINLQETLALWNHKTQVDPKYAALKPVPCKTGSSYMCVPVRVHKSTNGNIADGTIGYISLDYINRNVSKSRYVAKRELIELAVTTNETTAAEAAPVASGESEVTDPQTTAAADTSGAYSSSEVYNCNNTLYRRSGFEAHSCIKSLSLKQKVELVMTDVLKINQMRPAFKLDPRMSACMAYRESGFSPNAKGGTPDWGMYQVIDSTARSVLSRVRAVTPGFTGISWTDFRTKMLRSTLAQADLHHNVVYHKAKVSSADLNAMNRSMSSANAANVSSSVVQRIARRYNGNGSRAERYGNAIRDCFTCMTRITTKAGSVTSSGGLQGCLNKAKH